MTMAVEDSRHRAETACGGSAPIQTSPWPSSTRASCRNRSSSRTVQARLVHAEDIAQGAVGDALLALEQRHHSQEHGVELALGLGLLMGAWLRSGGFACPDEDRTILIHSQSLCRDEFELQVLAAGTIVFSPSFLRGDPEQAKPQGAVAVASLDDATIRRAALMCITVPAAAAPHSVRARRGTLRVSRWCGWIRLIPVLHPLPHVAVHIVQAPGIGLALSYGMGRATCIGRIPGVGVQAPGVTPKTIGRGGTSARGIFPLRLGGQAILAPSFSGVQGAYELLHIVPGDALDRVVRARKAARIRPHDGYPLSLSDGIFPQGEGLTDGHLTPLAPALCSHAVRPGRNQDELHAQATDARVHA
jgi:hypothetical protein